MTYKLTDDEFHQALREYLKSAAGEHGQRPVIPYMPDGNGGTDRAKTLGLIPFAEMSAERKAELLAEAV